MIKNILIIVIAGVLTFSFGCKSKRRQAASPPPPPQQKSVMMDEMQKEAAEQVTEENMDAELEKMEKEITADINS